MNLKSTIREISKVISDWDGPIVVAYSGGKDSSAVLKLVFSAVVANPYLAEKVFVIYCDTKVENPILDEFVKRTLRLLKKEAASCASGFKVRILEPALHQRYFVRIIGRGYPPPTSFFRWCTKDLRIRPVQTFVRSLGANPLVIIGTRRGESAQRDRAIQRISGDSKKGPLIQRQIDGGLKTHLYLPIAKYSLEDVWECLASLSLPSCIDVHRLAELYRHGGGECPMVRDTNDRPCASARFGCWVCTVVRRDRSAENLLEAGYNHLGSYFKFRTWISEIRNDLTLRCQKRRNGQFAPGPFRLGARKIIFDRVRELEKEIGRTLISKAEEKYIRHLWEKDRSSLDYLEMENCSAVAISPAVRAKGTIGRAATASIRASARKRMRNGAAAGP
jgi:DNA sulfur modification protein DndC